MLASLPPHAAPQLAENDAKTTLQNPFDSWHDFFEDLRSWGMVRVLHKLHQLCLFPGRVSDASCIGPFYIQFYSMYGPLP